MGNGGTCPPLEKLKIVIAQKTPVSEIYLNGAATLLFREERP